jgi:hypothetical protein
MSQENTLAAREVEHETYVAVLEAELKQAAADKVKLHHRLQQALEKEGTLYIIFWCILCKDYLPCLT